MTIRQVADRLYSQSLGHYVNGVKFTKQGLRTAVKAWMRSCENNKIKDTYVVELCLPDGKWLTRIVKYADRADGYDYIIPETREEESTILEALCN